MAAPSSGSPGGDGGAGAGGSVIVTVSGRSRVASRSEGVETTAFANPDEDAAELMALMMFVANSVLAADVARSAWTSAHESPQVITKVIAIVEEPIGAGVGAGAGAGGVGGGATVGVSQRTHSPYWPPAWGSPLLPSSVAHHGAICCLMVHSLYVMPAKVKGKTHGVLAGAFPPPMLGPWMYASTPLV